MLIIRLPISDRSTGGGDTAILHGMQGMEGKWGYGKKEERLEGAVSAYGDDRANSRYAADRKNGGQQSSGGNLSG